MIFNFAALRGLHSFSPRDPEITTLDFLDEAIEAAVFPRESWGSQFASLSSRASDHLYFNLFRVPEGLLSVLSCARCGKRRESLADARSTKSGEEGFLHLKAVAEASATALSRAASQFEADHSSCQPPLDADGNLDVSKMLPPDVLEAVARIRASAERDLREDGGDPFTPALHIFDSDKVAFIVPMFDLPDVDDGRARTIEAERRKFGIRELMRRKNSAIEKILFIATAWGVTAATEDEAKKSVEAGSLAHHPDRQELVIVAIVLGDMAVTGVATIERVVPGDETSKGSLSPFRWTVVATSLMVDGLMAANDRVGDPPPVEDDPSTWGMPPALARRMRGQPPPGDVFS